MDARNAVPDEVGRGSVDEEVGVVVGCMGRSEGVALFPRLC